MDPGSHPDLFAEAMGHGLQRAVQVSYCAATAAQVYASRRRSQVRIDAEHDELARAALRDQGRAERDASRAGWAPAMDPEWLYQAGLLATARAWGAAAPYADRTAPWYEPAAATAVRRCEERLRFLHPHAMARYDRLRAQGVAPAQAMAQAAALFAGPPRPHDAPYEPAPALEAGNGQARSGPGPQPGGAGGPSGDEPDRAVTAERARATDRDAAVGMPGVPRASERAANLGRSGDADGTASPVTARAARPWDRDFPIPIRDVVAAAAQTAGAVAQSVPAPQVSATRAARPVSRRS